MLDNRTPASTQLIITSLNVSWVLIVNTINISRVNCNIVLYGWRMFCTSIYPMLRCRQLTFNDALNIFYRKRNFRASSSHIRDCGCGVQIHAPQWEGHMYRHLRSTCGRSFVQFWMNYLQENQGLGKQKPAKSSWDTLPK